jgi:methionine biosynthesis protein MetW
MTAAVRARDDLRPDLQHIADMIAPNTRVLDIGCGDGALLDYLVHAKNCDGRGVELSQAGVHVCVSHGLSVIQGDADTDLEHYPNQAFDYVVLSQTLQATRSPRTVLDHLVRIGKHAIVSITNMGYWRTRLFLLVQGRMPTVGAPGARWYDNPNIHLCTSRDFLDLCKELDLVVERGLSIDRRGAARTITVIGRLANLRDEQGVFMLARNGPR